MKWLEQRDKVTSLTNKDPHKLALAKSQGSFSRMISSFPPLHGLAQDQKTFVLHYNFRSVVTK